MAEAAGSVKIVLAVDSTSYSAALDKAKNQLKQLEGSVGSAAATTRQQMGEARGSIALLGEEIGVHLPRHVRSFIATLPGVSSAMAAAFSTVAVVGIGLAVVETGKKIYEFIKQNKEAAEKNAEAWRKSREDMELSNLALEAETAHLQNELAKLQGKPQDTLKEALAEAALEATKLDRELVAATEDARKLLAEQQPWFSTPVTTVGTDYEQTMAKEHGKHLTEAKTLQDQLNESTSYGNSLITRRNELLAAQTGKKTYQDAFGQTQQRDTSRFLWKGMGSFQTEVDAVNQLMQSQSREQAHIQDQMTVDQGKAAIKKAQAQKDAIDAQKQAAAQQMQEWHRELDAVKALTDISVQDEATYWQALADSVTKNAPLHQAALEEANRAAIAANKKYQDDLMAGWESGAAAYMQQQALDQRMHDALMQGLEEAQRGVAEQVRAQQEAARENFENTAAEIEAAERIGQAAIQLQEQRGALSHLAAALATQQLHELSADQWRAALGVAQNAGAGIGLAPIERHGAGVGRQAEVDQAAVKSATALGALEDAATELAGRFTDIPAHIRDAVNATFDTMNGAILRTLTDPYHRGEWKQAGKQMFTGLAGTGLKLAEGSVLKFLTGGKRGESPALPVWTRSAEGAGAAMGSVAGAIGRLFTGKGDAAAGSAIGSFGSAVLKSLLHFGAGGDIPTGMPAIVGEQGPELFVPAMSGRIISNRTLNMGGSFTHVINVDARGAGDPAAVEASVHRTMGVYLQQIPSITLETMRNYNARRPSGSRI